MNADLWVAILVGPVLIIAGLTWAAVAALRHGIDGRDDK